jgi:hypothetical protein
MSGECLTFLKSVNLPHASGSPSYLGENFFNHDDSPALIQIQPF